MPDYEKLYHQLRSDLSALLSENEPSRENSTKNGRSCAARLRELKLLYMRNLITEEEYHEKRAKVLEDL